MARGIWGSLTKEPPMAEIDATLNAIQPAMRYRDLLAYAQKNTLGMIPGIIRQRFISVDGNGTIVYDRLLQLIKEHDIASPYIRKIMYFVWAYRDPRLRTFICERVANRQGKWQVGELLKKSNSDFFDTWHAHTTAVKARSNIEFYLLTMNVFDKSGTVHLDLDDNWLAEAAVVAAQYEPDPNERRRLINDPTGFLILKRWNGLVNATNDELRGLDLPETGDPSPLEDDWIDTSPATKSAGKDWSEKPLINSGNKTTTAIVDIVARERASNTHKALEKLLAETVRSLKYKPKHNAHIDLYFDTPNGMCITEIKSAHWRNYHSQIRKGVSQLLEYRYLYQSEIGLKPTMMLMMEIRPKISKAWLIKYLSELGIVVVWRDPTTGRIVTSCPIPNSLKGVVESAV